MPSALDWLSAPASTVPTVPDGVRVEDVGPTAWQVLLRDGVLRPVWGGVATPADRSPTPAVRASALRTVVPPRAVVGWAAAVWVHTGGPVPDRLDVLVAPRVRRPSPHPLRVPHESPLPDGDVVRLGDVRVTTVERTAVDLARWLPAEEAAAHLGRLVTLAGLRVEVALRALDAAPGQRFAERARTVLLAARCPGTTGASAGGQDVRPAGTPAALAPVIR